ncbi:MAG TPA: hypothetical protein PKY50_02345 [Candidatus Competibacter sp.]|nr:hypothetical protein [Candidatus Competibacter sp.]
MIALVLTARREVTDWPKSRVGSNSRSNKSASSKWRRPTKVIACRPRSRIVPGDGTPVGHNSQRSARSLPTTKPSDPNRLRDGLPSTTGRAYRTV